jgi:sugar lactone lactonase YvrE
MKHVHSRFIAVSAGLALAVLAAQSSAVGTRTFELRKGEDFKGGDLKGVAVDSSGQVHAGFNLGQIPVADGSAIWSALVLKDGSILLGTGNDGKLLVSDGATVKVAAETGSLVVTSLVEGFGGAVFAGTLPDGEVWKYAGGKAEKFLKLPGVEHVWQLAFDPKTKSLFAATGPEGKLFRIDQAGAAQVYFDAPEQHLMSVAVAPDGTVYAGASEKAKLYRVTGPGRATVLYDFGRTEVRAIAVTDKGAVYAVANEIKSGSYTPSRKGAGAVATPAQKPPKTTGKGTLYRFDPDGTPEQLYDDKDDYFTSLAIADDGHPYVGTGAEGRVYTVDEKHAEVLVADAEERQIGAMVLRGKQRFIAASDPAVLHPVRGVGGADAVWTSKVLDAGLRAHFGRLDWQATGQLELSTRSGNTLEPDDTWSAWSTPLAAAAEVTSPASRFLQVRARWNRDPAAVLSSVSIPFVTDNLRAVLTEVEAEGASPALVTGVESSGGPVAKKSGTSITLKWKVENPDKDELRYRLEYRLVGTTTWYELLPPKETLTKTTYSWDTSDLPEGRYRVRVSATDEISNPPDRVRRHELESTVILVDNTPPTITDLEATGKHVKGTVVDGVGPIARIEASVTGSDQWVPFFPRDGVFDEQREEFDLDVSALSPAGHALLTLRAYDRAGNSVVRNVSLK